MYFWDWQTVKDLVKPLSKKGSFRTSSGSQHVGGCQTIAKSVWEHFYHIFSSFWRQMTWDISPLVKLEVLGVFVNTLNADDKCPVRDFENL